MKEFIRPMCDECPHRVSNDLQKVDELFVNGKKQDYHPCHKNTNLMCTGSIIRLGLIQAGVPCSGDQINFTHKIDIPKEQIHARPLNESAIL